MEEPSLEVRRPDRTEFVRLGGSALTLGRSDDSDVAFLGDSSVSRAHAVVERDGDDWVVRDLGSANGTLVNGARIDGPHVLSAGDELRLGESRVVFRGAEAPTTTHRVVDGSVGQSEAPSGYLELGEEWRAVPARDAAPPVPLVAHVRTPPPPEPDRPPAAPRLERPREDNQRRGSVRGIARAIQIRKTETREVLEFRVDRYDEAGDRLPPVAVVFKDYQGGQVVDGEEVEVVGKWSRGTLNASRVTNLSTRAEVHGHGSAQKIVFVCFLIFFVCFMAFIVYSIVSAPEVENPFQ